MKRSETLEQIKQRGFHNDTAGAALIQAKKGIGSAAARKAFMDGKKAKERGELCGCPDCVAAQGEDEK
jgi:hypothetical protein